MPRRFSGAEGEVNTIEGGSGLCIQGSNYTKSSNGTAHREAKHNAAEINLKCTIKKRDLQDSYNPHHLMKLDSINQYHSNREQVEE